MREHAVREVAVTVIVPTFRDWERLALCLRALEEQTYPSGRLEILVVNNDPSDHPPPSLRLPANARLLQEPLPGSYAARNRGLREATGDLIGFTDADCIPEPDWVERAVEIAVERADEDARIAGLVRLFRAEGGSLAAWWYESVMAFNQRNNVRNGVAVTANLFVWKAVFDRVGGFDPSLFSGGDTAWNRLATQHGVPLVHAESVVVRHPARLSMAEIVRKHRRLFGSGYLRARRDGKAAAYLLRCFVPPARYGLRAWQGGQPAPRVLFACTMFWVIRMSMVFEAVRIGLGGIPERQ